MTYYLILLFFITYCFNNDLLEAKSAQSSYNLSDFPDLNGIPNFSNPGTISNTLFILTNPKSGSHLLACSIIKITGRPMRGRLPLWHFLNDPPCFPPENTMNYPLDFTKPTMYFGHEYHYLPTLNKNKNKLLFISRDYKENMASQIILAYNLKNTKGNEQEFDAIFRKEITEEGPVFKEFMQRLKTFDDWHPQYRYLVRFEDLVKHPERFIPQVLEFIEDNSEYQDFINSYDSFKKDVLKMYRLRDNGTGSESDLTFFHRLISRETLQEVDSYMARNYPSLWNCYLQEFQETN